MRSINSSFFSLSFEVVTLSAMIYVWLTVLDPFSLFVSPVMWANTVPQGKPNLLHASYIVVILDAGHWMKNGLQKMEVDAILLGV